MIEKLEKLVAAGIELIPATEVTTHFIFQRDGFVALVERRGDGFGGVGASGLLTEKGGLAPLVWRGDQAFFVGRAFEQQASDAEIAKLRAFSRDLSGAIS